MNGYLLAPGVTVITNDMEGEDIKVTIYDGRNYDSPGAYSKTLQYSAPSLQVIRYLTQSRNTFSTSREFLSCKDSQFGKKKPSQPESQDGRAGSRPR